MEKIKEFIQNEVINNSYQVNPFDPFDVGYIFDFKKHILKPDKLDLVAEALYEKINNLDNYQLGGLETTAVFLVTKLLLLAKRDGKNVNGFYIKKTGSRLNIEKNICGQLNNNPIILVDDLINSGYATLKQVDMLSSLGYRVSGVLVAVAFKSLSKYSPITDRQIEIMSLFNKSEFVIEKPMHRHFADGFPAKGWVQNFNKGIVDIAVSSVSGVLLVLTADGFAYILNGQSGEVYNRTFAGFGLKIVSAAGDQFLLQGDDRFLWLDAVNVKMVGEVLREFNSIAYVDQEECVIVLGLEEGVVYLSSYKKHEIQPFKKTKLDHSFTDVKYFANCPVIFLLSESGTIAGFSLESNKIIWLQKLELGKHIWSAAKSNFNKFTFDVGSGQVAFGTEGGLLFVVDIETGEIVLQQHLDYLDTVVRSPMRSAPVLHDGKCYFAGWDKLITKASLDSKEFEYQMPVGSKINELYKDKGDCLWAFGNNGKIFRLHTSNFTFCLKLSLVTLKGLDKVVYNDVEDNFIVLTDKQTLTLITDIKHETRL